MTHNTVALFIAYNGAPFAGFARQPDRKTVQGQIESALSTVLRREVRTVGAGRTDSGVHALGQVMSFDLEEGEEPDLFALRRSADVLSGDGISVYEARLVHPGFSSRFDAVRRTYRYRIFQGSAAPIFCAPYVWHISGELDFASMEKAAGYFIGEHDFRSFCVKNTADELEKKGLSTAREVLALSLFFEEHFGERCLTVEVVGNAFLHSMVRTLVGTLVEVGIGHHDPAWVKEVLSARNRAVAGPTAPAQGLTFCKVEYPPHFLDSERARG